jgi:hypothetical protein
MVSGVEEVSPHCSDNLNRRFASAISASICDSFGSRFDPRRRREPIFVKTKQGEPNCAATIMASWSDPLIAEIIRPFASMTGVSGFSFHSSFHRTRS